MCLPEYVAADDKCVKPTPTPPICGDKGGKGGHKGGKGGRKGGRGRRQESPQGQPQAQEPQPPRWRQARTLEKQVTLCQNHLHTMAGQRSCSKARRWQIAWSMNAKHVQAASSMIGRCDRSSHGRGCRNDADKVGVHTVEAQHC